jgi:UDP-N-acetylglucosamine 2-epimerase (non-hydrolysing)
MNMNTPKLKLAIIVGTRPEIIRLSEIIKACYQFFDTCLIHTGQNWDYNLYQTFFEDLDIKNRQGKNEPDICLSCAGDNVGHTIGRIIAQSYDALAELKPDCLLVLGDTHSCLSAIAAKRLHIPIVHCEAGNRCFDENLPEEGNRRIVDTIADVNLTYSENARLYLNAENKPRERTYVMGSPMAEVLHAHMEKIRRSAVLEECGVKKGEYILLSCHREENVDNEDNFLSVMNAVNALAGKYDVPVIYSTHPRSAKRIEERGFRFHPNVRGMKPFNMTDYCALQINAKCVVSDSGTTPEEISYFASVGMPFPAVVIRTSTERPEAMECGQFILAGISEKEVLQSVGLAIELVESGRLGTAVPDYADLNVSTRVVKIIQSYCGVVKRMVYRER